MAKRTREIGDAGRRTKQKYSKKSRYHMVNHKIHRENPCTHKYK